MSPRELQLVRAWRARRPLTVREQMEKQARYLRSLYRSMARNRVRLVCVDGELRFQQVRA